MSVCIMPLYSVFLLCVFPPPLSFYSSCILFFLCIHACTPMCYILHRHPFAGLHIWRALFVWRNIFCLEGYLLGGLYAWRAVSLFFCVSLSFLSPWLDQLSFRYQMVYLFRDHNPYSILHIPYSMLYVIYDLVQCRKPSSAEFFPCR